MCLCSKLCFILFAQTVAAFVDSWATPSMDADAKHCLLQNQYEPKTNQTCSPEIFQVAEKVCKKLYTDEKFAECLKVRLFSCPMYQFSG